MYDNTYAILNLRATKQIVKYYMAQKARKLR